MSKKQIKYIAEASNEAFNSRVMMKHGCVATINGKIIATGRNNYRTYDGNNFIHNSCTCHAEIDVLRKVYNTYVRNSGTSGGKYYPNAKVGYERSAKV